ncbi:hypothetical protein JCM9533A_03580 [Catenuloplanes niger JCM 9533]
MARLSRVIEVTGHSVPKRGTARGEKSVSPRHPSFIVAGGIGVDAWCGTRMVIKALRDRVTMVSLA